jgi:TolA-binding protein
MQENKSEKSAVESNTKINTEVPSSEYAQKSKIGMEERLELAQARFKDWIENEAFGKHKNKLIGAVVLAIACVGSISYYNSSVKQQAYADSEILGQALVFVYNGNESAAKVKLTELSKKSGLSDLTIAKSALLLGNIQYNNFEFDQAKASFEKAVANSSQSVVIKAGAESGLAAILIQKKEYAQAATSLEKFVTEYSRRSDKIEDQSNTKAEEDLAPNVADALYKLALCQVKLNQNDKAKATTERILRVYPNSHFSDLAKKLIITL